MDEQATPCKKLKSDRIKSNVKSACLLCIRNRNDKYSLYSNCDSNVSRHCRRHHSDSISELHSFKKKYIFSVDSQLIIEALKEFDCDSTKKPKPSATPAFTKKPKPSASKPSVDLVTISSEDSEAGPSAVPVVPVACSSAVPDAGPSAVPDAGPSAVPESGPSAVPDAGPSAVPDAGPSAVHDAGPSAVHDAGPSAVHDAGPSAVHDAGPSAVHDAGPSAVHDAGPSEDTVDPCSATSNVSFDADLSLDLDDPVPLDNELEQQPDRAAPARSFASGSARYTQLNIESFTVKDAGSLISKKDFTDLCENVRYIRQKLDQTQSESTESKYKQMEQKESASWSPIKSATNLSDLTEIVSDQINLSLSSEIDCNKEIHILTCLICNYYLKEGNPAEKLQSALGASFASGNLINADKLEMYKRGNKNKSEEDKKQWFRFKWSVQEHHRSSTHTKAIEFADANEAMEKRSDKVTKNIVSIALACVKANSAQIHFTPLLATMNQAGCDIGDIGHSRYCILLVIVNNINFCLYIYGKFFICVFHSSSRLLLFI